MDAMAEYRIRPDQTDALIDVEIVARLRIERFRQSDLGCVLAKVRLHMRIAKFARQSPRRFQLRRRRGDGETRRDGIAEAAPSVPFRQKRLAFIIAALWIVGQTGRRIAVHHDFAGDHAGVSALGLREKGLGRFGSYGAIDHRGRGAMPSQFIEKEAGDRGGVRGVRELLLLDESVFLQPLQKLRAVGGDDPGLRVMDMRVDESGQNQPTPIIVDDGVGRRVGEHVGSIADRDDPPSLHFKSAVFNIAIRRDPSAARRIPERKEPTANDARHVRISFSRSKAMRSISASAVAISALWSLPSRRSKAAMISRLLSALHRHNEGKAEFRPIGVIERSEAGKLFFVQLVEPGACLLLRRVPPSAALRAPAGRRDRDERRSARVSAPASRPRRRRP